MPAQEGLRPHGEDGPGGSGQVATERRRHETVRWSPHHSHCPSAKHTDLVPERDELEAYCSVLRRSEGHQVEDQANDGIDD